MEIKNWELIAKNLSGNASEQERKALAEWLKEHPENEHRFRQALDLWNAVKKEEEFEPDLQKRWETMRSRLLAEEPKTKRISIHSYRSQLWLAASIVMVLGISYFFLRKNGYEEVKTSDHMEAFYLPDSSLIWLNKNSRLKYPKAFGKERIVYLTGEAFFEVKRDTSCPFIIHTPVGYTRVLGTSFNLKAYEEGKAELAVVSGKVEFGKDKDASEKVLLLKGDKGTVLSDSREVLKEKYRDDRFLYWKNDRTEIKKMKLYREEIASSPSTYLYTWFKWKENLVKQTVIEGRIHNSAIFTSYQDVQLKATYYGNEGKLLGEEVFHLEETIRPGRFIEYRHRQKNWFRDTRDVKVELLYANVQKEQ